MTRLASEMTGIVKTPKGYVHFNAFAEPNISYVPSADQATQFVALYEALATMRNASVEQFEYVPVETL